MHSSSKTTVGFAPASGCDRLDDPSPPRGVLVVDDHASVREELERLLAADPELAPVTSAATASEAAVAARRLRPAVAVVDYRLPGSAGVSLTFQLKRPPNPPGVLIYSAYAVDRLVLAAVVAGADGVVEKGAGAEHLCAAVSAVAAHSRVMPRLSVAALDRLTAGIHAADLPIVEMLIDGLSADEVAHRMGIPTQWLELRRWAIVQLLVRSYQRSPR
jgi:DNA-binding NarL/FixJ family response regulator